jgi:SAM-dependent methyltransferase
MNYKLAYRVGFHPWEDAEDQAPFVEKIDALFEEEEQGRSAPFGPALDLGCGSGIWGLRLAERGWQVTGVDLVQKALDRARERVDQADAEMRLVQANVTELAPGEVGEGFRLILDTGTFHDFRPEQQRAMGRSMDAVASRDATVLLLAWPKRRRPLIRGVTQEEIASAFPGWALEDAGASGFSAPKPLELLLRPDERWYRLRRA